MFNYRKMILVEKLKLRHGEVAETVQSGASDPEMVTEGEAITNYLKRLKSKCAILTGDKARNMYVIHCKPWVCTQVMQATQTTETYETTDQDGTT